jgi:hypothetical protein
VSKIRVEAFSDGNFSMTSAGGLLAFAGMAFLLMWSPAPACGIATVSDGTWALLLGSARTWLARSPRRASALGGVGGLVMIGLGIRLAVAGRHD